MNTRSIRKDFPLLSRRINGKSIIYLDSSATSLKPQPVIDAVNSYYTRCTANVFRGIYTLSEEATCGYEDARRAVAEFIHGHSEEIVFTRNTSESLNLIAYSWLPDHVKQGDNVITTIMEHHSNFVPWQQMRKKYGYEFRIIKITPDGMLDLKDIERKVTKKTKLFAVTAVSNVLGTTNPVSKIIAMVRSINPSCFIVIDAAQAVPHMPVDVGAWGADAVAFSSHKMFGPSGIGVLWVRKNSLESMRPFQFGGDMIKEVHEMETVFNDIPHKFEAGTPYIEGAFGLHAAIRYIQKIGIENICEHEKHITRYAYTKLMKVPNLTVYGPKDIAHRAGIIAFRIGGVHPHDVAQLLDEDNICMRVGYHCAMPLHEFLHISPTVRVSFHIYNDTDDIDALVEGLWKVNKVFGI